MSMGLPDNSGAEITVAAILVMHPDGTVLEFPTEGALAASLAALGQRLHASLAQEETCAQLSWDQVGMCAYYTFAAQDRDGTWSAYGAGLNPYRLVGCRELMAAAANALWSRARLRVTASGELTCQFDCEPPDDEVFVAVRRADLASDRARWEPFATSTPAWLDALGEVADLAPDDVGDYGRGDYLGAFQEHLNSAYRDVAKDVSVQGFHVKDNADHLPRDNSGYPDLFCVDTRLGDRAGVGYVFPMGVHQPSP